MMYEYHCKFVRARDGDTVILNIDLGLHTWRIGEPIRLLGINCPELIDRGGPEAKAFSESWFEQQDPDKLLLQTHKNQGDKYGRWLGVVRGTTCLNDELLSAGHAVRA